MKKFFVYTEEQEQEINEKLGYTQKEYDRLGDGKQWQRTINIPKIKDFIRRLKQKECPTCGSKLVWIKECTYIGFSLLPGVDYGSLKKTYEVKKKRYCPNCQKILE